MEKILLFENEFAKAEAGFFPGGDERLLYFEWYPKSADMFENDFKAVMELYRDTYLEKISPLKLKHLHCIIDTQEFGFTISPEVQEWVNNDIYTAFSKALADVKSSKTAFIMPKEFFANLSLEQNLEHEVSQNELNVGMFESEEKALAWLKKITW